MVSTSALSWLSLTIAIAALMGASFVFVRVQIMQSYPFYSGVYGNEFILPGVTYTIALELFGLIAGVAIFSRGYLKAGGPRKVRVLQATAWTMIVLGIIVASVVYVENYIVWGDILPGVHLWTGFPGGGGYPWGGERVGYNLCFVPSNVVGDCGFLNYGELLLSAMAFMGIGLVVRYRWRRQN